MTIEGIKNRHQYAVAYMLGTFPNITETFVMREIEGLRAHGYDVPVYAIKRSSLPSVERSICSEATLQSCNYARPDRLLSHLAENLIQLITHPFKYLRALRVFLVEAPRLPPSRFIRSLYHFYCGMGFVRLLRRQNVKHMHCHFQSGMDMALAVNLFCDLPFSFSAHASDDIYNRTPLLEKKIERASFVVPVCEYNRRFLDSLTRYRHSAKLKRIYNGIDVDEAARLANGSDHTSQESVGEGYDLRILSVGSLVKMKGHATLAEACALLAKRNYRIQCQVIGDGPERETLERVIAQRASGIVELQGAASLREVYLAMGRADVFVLLSQVDINGVRDGFPTVILEAMAVGLPVVATWISGTPEMVVEGKTGFLVHERDMEGAANALERLILEPELRTQFGKEGRERVKRLFQSHESVASLSQLFSQSLLRADDPVLQ